MYTALYRAYRPEVFDQLLGQEHIARILKNQIAMGTTSHAYLFCGTRGTGKTTTARLLAKGLNCLSDGERPCGECAACQAIRDGNFLDVVEIDAASNRGIDDIRQLRDSVNYPPAVGRNKVYIIDEVHMLSTEAFNALLKTLEEPPEYVTFILATTEPRKLPATILSRCLRLDFKRIPETTLIDGMRQICRDIGIEVTEPALRIIAANADGSVRDGLSILDQCISGGEKVVDAPQVLDFLGASGETVFIELTDLVSKRRTGEAIAYLASVLADGKDVRQLIRDWVGHYRNLMMTKFIRDPQGVINLSVENIDRVREQSSVMDLEDINRGILELSKTADQARWSTQPRILLEVCIVNLCQGGSAIPTRPVPAKVGHASAPAPDERAPAAGGAGTVGTRATAAPKSPAPTQGMPVAPEVSERAPAAGDQELSMKPAGGKPAAGTPDPEESSGTLSALDAMIAAAEKAGAPSGAPDDVASGAPGDVAAAAPSDITMAIPDDAELTGPDDLEVTAQSSAAPGEASQTVPSDSVTAASEPAGESYDSGAAADDLTAIWDDIFSAGEHQKGSIYLIRSNGMLTDMDEFSFTVTVGNDLHKRQTERNRKFLEELMEARTGQRRHMKVEVKAGKKDAEISAEEAAANASEVLGTTVTVE